MGRCPFHDERTPSFSVSQEKGVYHCFGCGKSGNIFTFLVEHDNISFFEAVKTLAEKANIHIEYEDIPPEDKNQIEILYEINKQAAKFFFDKLMDREGEYAREYLSQRGIKEETIRKFGLGFSSRLREEINKFLLSQFDKKDLAESGLVINLAMNESKDRFRGRLMFPIINESSKVVGFGGRKIFPDQTDEAKYINSPETKIYNKSRILYGLNLSKQVIKDAGFAILVEGYMDLIALYQSGFQNVIASSGTSLTTLQIKNLSRYTNEVVILYDSDLAGQNASRRAIELIIEHNFQVSIVELPACEDPDSFLKKYGEAKFVNILQNRLSIIDYIAGKYQEQGKLKKPEGKTEFVKEIISLIAKIPDNIKREFYIRDISERFGIFENIIRRELSSFAKLKKQGLTRVEVREESKTKKRDVTGLISSNELMLIRLLVDADKETKEFLASNIEFEHLSNPRVARIIDIIMNQLDKGASINSAALFNLVDDEELKDILGKALLEETYVLDKNKNSNNLKEANIVITQFKLNNVRSQIETLDEKLKQTGGFSDDVMKMQSEKQKLLAEKIGLENKLRSFSN